MTEKTVPDAIMNAVQAGQEYHAKVMQFAASNYQAAVDYFQKLAAARAPSEAIELTATHLREQSDNLTAQAKELAQLAQQWLSKSGSSGGL
jgi:hypothetical protein